MVYLFVEGYVRNEGLAGEAIMIFHPDTGAYLLSAVLGGDVWPGQRVRISHEDGRVYGIKASEDEGEKHVHAT